MKAPNNKKILIFKIPTNTKLNNGLDLETLVLGY